MSGQTYVNTGACNKPGPSGAPAAHCHPPWAVAGVDYPVGPSCGTNCGFGQPGSATDPTVASNWPAGCTVPSGPTARNVVVCTGPGGVNIGPMDFSAQGNCKLRVSPCIGASIGFYASGTVT
jgi:hypothetical protein